MINLVHVLIKESFNQFINIWAIYLLIHLIIDGIIKNEK